MTFVHVRLKRILMLGNYRGFFDFYGTRDQVCRSLLNQYIDRVRVKCLLMVCKTFGEKVPITTLAGILGEDEDLLEAIIRQEGGIIQGGNFMLKPSYDKLLKSEHLASKKVSILFNWFADVIWIPSYQINIYFYLKCSFWSWLLKFITTCFYCISLF